MKSTLALVALLASTQAFAYNDVDPYGFDKEKFASHKSRAEVRADARAAVLAGEIPRGELWTPAVEGGSTKTRSQVVAETREAARLGLLTSRGEVGPRQPTPQEEEQIRMAGLQAIGGNVASD